NSREVWWRPTELKLGSANDSRLRSPESFGASLLQSHAVGEVGHCGSPVREDASNADVERQHVEHLEDVAVTLDGRRGRLIVKVARRARARQNPRTLQRPGDDVETCGPRVVRVPRRYQVVRRVYVEQREER